MKRLYARAVLWLIAPAIAERDAQTAARSRVIVQNAPPSRYTVLIDDVAGQIERPRTVGMNISEIVRHIDVALVNSMRGDLSERHRLKIERISADSAQLHRAVLGDAMPCASREADRANGISRKPLLPLQTVIEKVWGGTTSRPASGSTEPSRDS